MNPQIRDLKLTEETVIRQNTKNSLVAWIASHKIEANRKLYLPSNKSGNGCADESKRKDCTKVFEKIFLKNSNVENLVLLSQI